MKASASVVKLQMLTALPYKLRVGVIQITLEQQDLLEFDIARNERTLGV